MCNFAMSVICWGFEIRCIDTDADVLGEWQHIEHSAVAYD
jgi:hypothetical protein